MTSDPVVPLERAAAGRYSAAFLKAIDRGLAVKPEDRPRDTKAMRALLGPEQSDPRASVPGSARRTVLVAAAIITITAGSIAGLYVSGDKIRPITEKPDTAVQPFDPVQALDEVFKGRDPNHAVSVSLENGQVRIGQDLIRFTVRTSKPGYLYLLTVGTNRSDFFLLFPNAIDDKNEIRAGRDIQLPRAPWQITAEGPPGTDHFVVIVSENRRDFKSAGLTSFEVFGRFPKEDAERLSRAHSGWPPLFAGRARCASTPCAEAYGAASFSIEEIAK